MSENVNRNHRLVDQMTIDVCTEGSKHEIAFERLKEMIDGYDKLLGVLYDYRSGMADDSRTISKESKNQKAKHSIYLAPATEGSYKAQSCLYDDSDDEEQLPLNPIRFDSLFDVTDSIARGDAAGFAEQLPSRLARCDALAAVKMFSPKTGESITVTTDGKKPRIVKLKPEKFIDFESLQPVEENEIYGVVIASISSVDFEAKKMKLRPGKHGIHFWVSYDPNIEDHLVANRRQPVTVHCSYRYDLNGNITEVKDATGIEELDLRPVRIDSFDARGANIRFKEPLDIPVALDDETGQVFVSEYEPLGMIVYADCQDEIKMEIMNDLGWRWSHIVESDVDVLAPDAIAIREIFRSLVVD